MPKNNLRMANKPMNALEPTQQKIAGMLHQLASVKEQANNKTSADAAESEKNAALVALCAGIEEILKTLSTKFNKHGFHSAKHEYFILNSVNLDRTLSALKEQIDAIHNQGSACINEHTKDYLSATLHELQPNLPYHASQAYIDIRASLKRKFFFDAIFTLVFAAAAVPLGIFVSPVVGCLAFMAVTLAFGFIVEYGDRWADDKLKSRVSAFLKRHFALNDPKIPSPKNEFEFGATLRNIDSAIEKIAEPDGKAELAEFIRIDEHGNSQALALLKPRIELRAKQMRKELQLAIDEQFKIQELMDKTTSENKLEVLTAIRKGIELKIQLLDAKLNAHDDINQYVEKKIAKFTNLRNVNITVDNFKAYFNEKYNRQPSATTLKQGEHSFKLFTPCSKKITTRLEANVTEIKALKAKLEGPRSALYYV